MAQVLQQKLAQQAGLHSAELDQRASELQHVKSALAAAQAQSSKLQVMHMLQSHVICPCHMLPGRHASPSSVTGCHDTSLQSYSLESCQHRRLLTGCFVRAG